MPDLIFRSHRNSCREIAMRDAFGAAFDEINIARDVVRDRHDSDQRDEDQRDSISEILGGGLAQTLQVFAEWTRDADAQSALWIAMLHDDPVRNVVQPFSGGDARPFGEDLEGLRKTAAK